MTSLNKQLRKECLLTYKIFHVRLYYLQICSKTLLPLLVLAKITEAYLGHSDCIQELITGT